MSKIVPFHGDAPRKNFKSVACDGIAGVTKTSSQVLIRRKGFNFTEFDFLQDCLHQPIWAEKTTNAELELLYLWWKSSLKKQSGMFDRGMLANYIYGILHGFRKRIHLASGLKVPQELALIGHSWTPETIYIVGLIPPELIQVSDAMLKRRRNGLDEHFGPRYALLQNELFGVMSSKAGLPTITVRLDQSYEYISATLIDQTIAMMDNVIFFEKPTDYDAFKRLKCVSIIEGRAIWNTMHQIYKRWCKNSFHVSPKEFEQNKFRLNNVEKRNHFTIARDWTPPQITETLRCGRPVWAISTTKTVKLLLPFKTVAWLNDSMVPIPPTNYWQEFPFEEIGNDWSKADAPLEIVGTNRVLLNGLTVVELEPANILFINTPINNLISSCFCNLDFTE